MVVGLIGKIGRIIYWSKSSDGYKPAYFCVKIQIAYYITESSTQMQVHLMCNLSSVEQTVSKISRYLKKNK